MKWTFLVGIVLLLAGYAHADGLLLKSQDLLWSLHHEDGQVAAINHREGFQDLLVSVLLTIDKDTRAEKLVWILPIPSTPRAITLDLLTEFPRFKNTPLDDSYKAAVGDMTMFMLSYGTVLSPAVLLAKLLPLEDKYSYRPGGPPPPAPAAAAADEVTVHQRLEKQGFTSELITTKSAEALRLYLQEKKLSLPPEAKPIIEEYVGKDYSFAVTYIGDPAILTPPSWEVTRLMPVLVGGVRQMEEKKIKVFGGKNLSIGVHARFPTDDLYYPLKPTRVYGDRQIPVTLYALGHVTPEIPSAIARYSRVQYFIERGFTPPAELGPFFGSGDKIEKLAFTRIDLYPPASRFTEDLRITRVPPLSVRWKTLVVDYRWISGIVLLGLLSLVSSVLAGVIIFRGAGVQRKWLILPGLWNCLSVVAFVIATIRLKVATPDRMKQRNQKVLYIVLFSLSLCAGIALMGFFNLSLVDTPNRDFEHLFYEQLRRASSAPVPAMPKGLPLPAGK